jgi:hypothetical protein
MCIVFTSEGINPTKKTKKMLASIISSDRYIAIKFSGSNYNGLTYDGTLRILTRDTNGEEFIVPCRWNAANKRLESVALNKGGVRVPNMYTPTNRLISKLNAAGYLFEMLNELQAEELTT